MKEKERRIEFEKRVKYGIAYCEDIPNNQIKEVATKFYDKFNENISCFTLENKSADYKEGYIQAVADICGKLDKTAIELGVDLKEYYGKL